MHGKNCVEVKTLDSKVPLKGKYTYTFQLSDSVILMAAKAFTGKDNNMVMVYHDSKTEQCFLQTWEIKTSI